MKKLLFGIGTLLMCLVLTSCNNYAGKIESIAEDIKADGADWDADEWEKVIRESSEIALSFWESEPSKEEIKEFEKAGKKLKNAINKFEGKKKVEKAITEAYKNLAEDKDFEKLSKKIDKARTNAKKKVDKKGKKDKKDKDDDDEDYEDED